MNPTYAELDIALDDLRNDALDSLIRLIAEDARNGKSNEDIVDRYIFSIKTVASTSIRPDSVTIERGNYVS